MISYLSRLARVVAVTIVTLPAFGLAGITVFPGIGGRRPQILRWYFEACGGAFVKIGQVLAMRYDILKPEYCAELNRLFDGLSPEKPERIFATIERELGRPIGQCFREIDTDHLGTASIAQVHRAVLHTGEEVAVKVMRPGMRRRMKHDLRSFHALAWALDLTGLFLPIRVKSLAAEVTQLTLEELDFRREARNADLLQQRMASDAVDHRSPVVYWKYTTGDIITMELFKGVWCTDILRAIEANDTAALEAYSQQGITPKRAARLIFRSIMEQCYHHRVFHADPHAGNLVFLEGGTLAYIDFGMVGWLDERQWALQYRLFENIAAERLHAAYESMLDTLEPLNVRDVQPFETSFKTNLWDWMLAARNPNSTIEEKSTGRFLWRTTLAMREAGLRLPWALMRLHRTTLTSDMAELTLYPQLDVLAEMREFFQIDAFRTMTEGTDVELLESQLALQYQRVRDLPTLVGNLADFFEFRLPVLARSYGDALTRFERATNTAFRYTRTVCIVVSISLFISLWWVPSFINLNPEDGRPLRFFLAATLGLVGWALSRMVKLYDEPG